MVKKTMAKSYLFTCSVIMLLVIIFAVTVYGTNSTTIGKKSAKITSTTKVYKSQFIFRNEKDNNDFSFADEALPINDVSVKRALKRSLIKHNYKHIQSDILQVKAALWFPVIEPILKAYGIPDDFKYVPLVESGLCEGTSPKGARGLWQFMPGTARTYGLKVKKGDDERLNVRKSTVAACRYIRDLYVEFNSWTLAAAAYNNGEIKLQRAINRQNEDNYFLMHLNHETARYVYNIIAMKAIISHPRKYGYKIYQNNFKPSELLAFN